LFACASEKKDRTKVLQMIRRHTCKSVLNLRGPTNMDKIR
ncbi:MAG: hypothetical protein QOE70_3404, partial [Chthoniobacter sp.]|nr:hypothetical protein [Chthoniobacter sp.]